MLRISLLDNKDKPYALPLAHNEIMVKYSVVTIPPRFVELFNFLGLLNDKLGEDTFTALETYVDRWKGVGTYSEDVFAPTAGNVRVAVERLLRLARLFPNGIWAVELAKQIEAPTVPEIHLQY